MQTLSGYELEIKRNRLYENVISDDFKQKRYNLKALKNLYIQDLRTTKSRKNGFITGAIVGGIIDSSIGDDSIVDGLLIGGLLGSSFGDYQTGSIYATLQFFDNLTLNIKLDNEEELIHLQEFAIKNHDKGNVVSIKSLEIVDIDKQIFNSTQNISRLRGIFMISAALIIALLNHYSIFEFKSKVDTPMGDLASNLGSPFLITILVVIMFTMGVFQLLNAGGQAIVKKQKTISK